jgi:hypothetical protein
MVRDTLLFFLFIGKSVFLFLAILFPLHYALEQWLAPPPDDFDPDWEEARHQEREFWRKEAAREFRIAQEERLREVLRELREAQQRAEEEAWIREAQQRREEEAWRRYWDSLG